MQWRLCKCTIAFLPILSILSMQVKMFSKYWGNLKINPCIPYLSSSPVAANAEQMLPEMAQCISSTLFGEWYSVCRGISWSLTTSNVWLRSFTKAKKCWLKSPVIPNVFSSGVCLNNVVSKKSNSNLQWVEIVQQRYQEIKEMLIQHGNHNDFSFKISTAHSKSLGSTDAFCRNSLFQHAFQISSCNHERIVN